MTRNVWQADELKVIDCLQKNPSHFYNLRRGINSTSVFKEIAEEINMDPVKCHKIWTTIRNGYRHFLRRKDKPTKTKYLHEKVSFLLNFFKSNSQPEYKVSDIDEDEDSQDGGVVFTFGLETIDDLLIHAKEYEVRDTFWYSEFLSPVYNRIDQALLRIAEENKPINVGSIENQNIDSNLLSASSYKDPLLLDDESTSNNYDMRNTVSASTLDEVYANRVAQDMETQENPSQALTIKYEKQDENIDQDMETIFDIYKSSDSTTFYQKLGLYVKRFSKEKQEELRLKICCLVTEKELEED